MKEVLYFSRLCKRILANYCNQVHVLAYPSNILYLRYWKTKKNQKIISKKSSRFNQTYTTYSYNIKKLIKIPSSPSKTQKNKFDTQYSIKTLINHSDLLINFSSVNDTMPYIKLLHKEYFGAMKTSSCPFLIPK